MDKKHTVFNWQLFLGLVLVLAGGVFLADLFLPFSLMRLFWPVLIVLFGLTFFLGMLFAGRAGSGLAIPGTVITTLGLLLFVQNTFHLWVTWTYAWALLISAVGLGLLLMNAYHKRVNLRRAAGLIIGIGLTLFVVFGFFFEIILDLAGSDLYSGIFLGAGLVLLGLFVAFSRPLFSRVGKSKPGPVPSEDGMPVEADDADIEAEAEVFEEGKVILEGQDFSRLNFKSVGEVFLTQGDVCMVEFSGSSELIEKIKTQVEDGELSITYDAKIRDWSDLEFLGGPKLEYKITVKSLEAINMGGAGNLVSDHLGGEALSLNHSGLGKMQIDDLQCQALTVELGGLGEVVVAGEVQSQTVTLSGAGSYEAEGLLSQTAKVMLSGAGSANVWVEGELDATVSGVGGIHYKGNATVTKSSTGIGEIKPL